MSSADIFAASVAFGAAAFIWADELAKLFRRRALIAALAFVSLPLVWVGEWLNERVDAKTASLWRICPWCRHDAGKTYYPNSCGCGRRSCSCVRHGQNAWYRRPEARA